MTQKPIAHGTRYAYYGRKCRCATCAHARTTKASVTDLRAKITHLEAELVIAQRTVDRAIAEVVRHWTEKKQWKAEALAARRKQAAA